MVSPQPQVLTEAVRVSQQVYALFIHPLLALFILYFEESGVFDKFLQDLYLYESFL